MSNARMAALFVQSVAKNLWPNDSIRMECNTVDWLNSFANIRDSGSHKYIPCDKLNADLKCEEGSGIYGYVQFQDGSFLLKTCDLGVAVWDGKDTDVAIIPTRK